MTKLNNLKDENWKKLDKIIMFGFGRQGRKMYLTLSRDFNVVAIIDNSPEKQGTRVGDNVILSFEQSKKYLYKYKIVVTASQHYYQSIKEQLDEQGLIENIDYVMYQQFITEWYYKYQNKINVLKTIIAITSKCTLNCENCMQFLPYWDTARRKELPLEDIKENLEVYFRSVDYVLNLDIVGGEPFLYSRLEKLIRLIGENYRERMGYVVLITNGMIVPNNKVFELLKKYSIGISISDYSANIVYKHNIPIIIKKSEEYGVDYMLNQNIDWFDFGFPRDKYHYEGEEAVNHTQCCNSIEHVLDDKKLFYCGLEWSAQKGNLFPAEKRAYVDLQKVANGLIDKKEILELILGNIEGGYLDFCKLCGGFVIDNNNKVMTAKQLERKV